MLSLVSDIDIELRQYTAVKVFNMQLDSASGRRPFTVHEYRTLPHPRGGACEEYFKYSLQASKINSG
jgi:hypothetical protein